jgi:hypothetical protein
MARMNSTVVLVALACLLLMTSPALGEEDVEILGVRFAPEKVVEGKTLKLNGVAYRKALGFFKVYVVGLYLERPTGDPQEVITSEQVKQLHFHYLSDRVTAKKLRDGFLDLMKECNPTEMYERNEEDVQLYASWLDKDMRPGLTSISTYVPALPWSTRARRGEPSLIKSSLRCITVTTLERRPTKRYERICWAISWKDNSSSKTGSPGLLKAPRMIGIAP